MCKFVRLYVIVKKARVQTFKSISQKLREQTDRVESTLFYKDSGDYISYLYNIITS